MIKIMSRFELTILGCGSATSSFRHNPSCQVVNYNERLLMIDCGESSQLAFRRNGLHIMRLTDIFISHLHGDHTFGLPGLLSTMSLLGRTNPLTIHIFDEGIAPLRDFLKAFSGEMSYELQFHAIAPRDEVVWENDNLTVGTFPLVHRVPCTGFLFREKPKRRRINGEAVVEAGVPHHFMNNLRDGLDYVAPDGRVIANALLTFDPEPPVSYAYCSDTLRSAAVAQKVKGVQWIYHEATYDDSLREKARQRFHSTAAEAAHTASEAQAKQLIIGHFSKRYADETPLLNEAKAIFPNTRLANEGLRLDLNKY